MLYSEFKTFLATFLWRDGDTVLLAAMDSLIKMAEASLQRELKVQDATATVTLDFVSSSVPITLPSDYRTPDVLLGPGGDYRYVTPGLFWASTGGTAGGSGQPAEEGTFTIIGRDLYISGFSTTAAPAEVRLVYYRTIPSYALTNASWVADLHLDLFAYAVLMHAGRFVRDDDRVPGWAEAYTAALTSVITEDVPNRYAKGAPLRIRYGGRHG